MPIHQKTVIVLRISEKRKLPFPEESCILSPFAAAPKQFSAAAASVWMEGVSLLFFLSTPGEPDACLPDFAGWLDSVAFEK